MMATQERIHTKLKLVDNIVVITFDSPNVKMNSLNEEVMTEFCSILHDIETNLQIHAAVLISGKPGCFIAGADIRMLATCKSVVEATQISQLGQQVMAAIENSKKPIVAAIQGVCLGGGLETALACHYRIAVRDKKTSIGLPEVMLGLLPGAGGTQRLRQVTSLSNTLDMALTGRTVRTNKAKQMGIVDLVVDPFPLGSDLDVPSKQMHRYLEATAVTVAKELASGKLNAERTKSLQDRILGFAMQYGWFKDKFFGTVREQVMKKSGGFYPAPLKIINVIRTSIDEGPKAGYEAEAKAFGELVMSPQSKALIHLFKAQTECKKNRFGTPKTPVKHLGVVEAGPVGAGIAHISINKGYNVTLKEASKVRLTRSVQQVHQGYEVAVKRKRCNSLERDYYLSHLVPTLNYDDCCNTEMVIEAVSEQLTLKHKVIEELEAFVPPHCIIVSHTSVIPITKIAEGSSRPDRVIGMHYFSPIDKTLLLEVITTAKTSQDTIASAVAVGLKQGKVVITVNDGPGFYTTRILAAMMLEGVRLLQEGVNPKELDQLCKKFGFSTGIATLADEIGLDIVAHMCKQLTKALGDRIAGGDPHVLKNMVEAGFMGRKSGKGFFTYDKSKRPEENLEALKIVQNSSLDSKGAFVSDEDKTMRMVLKFVNSAVQCLEENVLESPSQGDIAAVLAWGFPAFAGGPFYWVDAQGADKVVTKMETYCSVYGECFKPARTLIDMAKNPSRKFYPKTD